MSQEETLSEIKQEILESGVFKLNDKQKPIGLTLLTTQKKLSKRNKYQEYKTLILRELIEDIARAFLKYKMPPTTFHFMEVFKKKLDLLLSSWNLSPDDLGKNYDKFVKEVKKALNSEEFSGLQKEFTKIDTLSSFRRRNLLYKIFEAFHRHLDNPPINNASDLFHYASILLICCGVESGQQSKVYARIKRDFLNHFPSPEGKFFVNNYFRELI